MIGSQAWMEANPHEVGLLWTVGSRAELEALVTWAMDAGWKLTEDIDPATGKRVQVLAGPGVTV